jgi:hypothetical protein
MRKARRVAALTEMRNAYDIRSHILRAVFLALLASLYFSRSLFFSSLITLCPTLLDYLF